jgi:hypothetical protein
MCLLQHSSKAARITAVQAQHHPIQKDTHFGSNSPHVATTLALYF